MSKRFRFELNRAGVRELMQSEEMQAILTKEASNIRNRAGEGYAQDVYVGRTRANAMVWPESEKAIRDNLKNNTAIKAVKG